jgi:hypothetical protein
MPADLLQAWIGQRLVPGQTSACRYACAATPNDVPQQTTDALLQGDPAMPFGGTIDQFWFENPVDLLQAFLN